MKKEQADKIAMEIIKERNKKADEITEKAKNEGKLMCGLDTNRELFVELDKEYFAKLQELAKQIDE